MPKLDRIAQLSTRLSLRDLERFRVIAYRKSLAHSGIGQGGPFALRGA